MPLEDPKLFFAIAAALTSTFAYIPYLKDLFSGKTRPHVYTWLIWTLTTGTAAAGAWYGGGGWGAVNLTLWSILTLLTFSLSLRYGTRNITRSDTLLLSGTLLAIIVWWQLDNPLLALIMVTAIDAIAYLPTFRKCFSEPWSESLTAWSIFIFAPLFIIASLEEYNLFTLMYMTMSLVANIILVAFCLVRRRAIPKPIQSAVE